MPNVSIMQGNSGKWDSVEFAAENGRFFACDPATGAPRMASGITFAAGGDISLSQNLLMVGKYIELANMTAPAAPVATKVRLYAANSGGKVALFAIFPTGAAQQIAIEP